MEPKSRTAMKHPSKTQHKCDFGIKFGLQSFRHLSSTRGGSRGSLDLLTSPLTEQTCVFLCGNYPFKSCDWQISKKNPPWPIHQRWFNKTREFKQRLSKWMKTSVDKPAIWTDPSSPRRIFPAFTSLRLKKIHKQSQTTKSRRAASILLSIWTSPTAQLELCPRGRWRSNLSSVTLKFTHFTEHSCHMGGCKTLFLQNKCKGYLWICPFLCR